MVASSRRDETALEAVAPKDVDVAVAVLAVHPVHVDPRPVALAELEQNGPVPATELEHADALPAGEPGVDFGEDSADAIDELGVSAGAKGQLRPILGIPDHGRLVRHWRALLPFYGHLQRFGTVSGHYRGPEQPLARRERPFVCWREHPFVCSISKILHERVVVDNARFTPCRARRAMRRPIPADKGVGMVERLNDARILIYSHDSFGLGHLRRCRAIAHALVDRFKGLSILILSGSPIIGSFDFRARVDFVRIPGVIKLHDGEYQSLGPAHRRRADDGDARGDHPPDRALRFRPDLFLVDKEPLGLKGEVLATLEMLKAMGTTLVLGLRDIMDEPSPAVQEWERKQVLPALEHLYDEIWVYGLERFANPLAGVRCPLPVRRKIVYTGYLRRAVPHSDRRSRDARRRSALCAGDGRRRRRRHVGGRLGAVAPTSTIPTSRSAAVVVLGPFMPAAMQRQFRERAEAHRENRGRDVRHARRGADGRRGRCRCDGRLQHVLRDPFAR